MASTPGTGPVRRRALVLRHHVEDDAGLIGAALEHRAFTIETTLVDATHRVPAELVADLVVVLGSNSSVYDDTVRATWLNEEIAALRRADWRGTPIFGICFGAQILSELCGGAVEAAPSAEIGWYEIDVAPGAPVAPGPWFEYHHDRCVLPADATVWATTPVAVQAFTIGRHVGVQFHPEIDGDQLARWFDSVPGSARADIDNENAMLARTRAETPAAAVRAGALVDAVLAHALVAVRDGGPVSA